jgi:hypothetical protein
VFISCAGVRSPVQVCAAYIWGVACFARGGGGGGGAFGKPPRRRPGEGTALEMEEGDDDCEGGTAGANCNGHDDAGDDAVVVDGADDAERGNLGRRKAKPNAAGCSKGGTRTTSTANSISERLHGHGLPEDAGAGAAEAVDRTGAAEAGDEGTDALLVDLNDDGVGRAGLGGVEEGLDGKTLSGPGTTTTNRIDDSAEEVQRRGQMRMLLAEQRLRSAMGSIAKRGGGGGGGGGGYARVGLGDEDVVEEEEHDDDEEVGGGSRRLRVGGGATYALD